MPIDPREDDVEDPMEYHRLMQAILTATTEQELVDLAKPILAYCGGEEVRFDFAETWMMAWRHIAGDRPIPPGTWPPPPKNLLTF